MTPDKIDEVVRRALHETAEQMEPSPDAWARINERPTPRVWTRKPVFVPAMAAAAVIAVVVIALVAQNLGRNDHAVSTQPTVPAIPQYVLGSVPNGYKADPVQPAFHQQPGSTEKNNPEQQAPTAVCRRTAGEGADRVCTDALGYVTRAYSSTKDKQAGFFVVTGYNVQFPDGGQTTAPRVDVAVRGKPGRYEADPANGGVPAVETLFWTERPGLVVKIVRIGVVNGADETVNLAAKLRAEPLSLDEAPAVVASGDLPSSRPGADGPRWYLAVGRWEHDGYCMTVAVLPVESGGWGNPHAVDCFEHPIAGTGGLALPRGSASFSNVSSSVLYGAAGAGVAGVRLTPSPPLQPTDVDVVGRDAGFGVGFFAELVPEVSYRYAGLDASGNPVSQNGVDTFQQKGVQLHG